MNTNQTDSSLSPREFWDAAYLAALAGGATLHEPKDAADRALTDRAQSEKLIDKLKREAKGRTQPSEGGWA